MTKVGNDDDTSFDFRKTQVTFTLVDLRPYYLVEVMRSLKGCASLKTQVVIMLPIEAN